MMEKGKELRCSQVDMSQKQSFDIAQARELTNVLSAKALRSLTENFDPASAMSMGWVLTTKADGSITARLVVLGFQASNVAESDTAAPTMARVGRNLILAINANKGFKLKAGDVTAAFPQAAESLENGMRVWAPAELAVMFGAGPHNPIMFLRITKVFHGLVQVPRCWFNDISGTMKKHGWNGKLS